MLHPNTELRFVNDVVGHGVYATDFIPKGTITWVRDVMDREIVPSQMDELPLPLREKVLTYSYRNNKGNYILCWDHTKYINHSFDANCMTTPYGFEIAVRHIAAGEQLTNDYGTFNIIESFEPLDEGHPRKVVCPDDLSLFYPQWDAQVREAIAFVNDVAQPLQSVFADDKWLQVQRLSLGQELVTSLQNCLFMADDINQQQ